jgi:hypothetical protein
MQVSGGHLLAAGWAAATPYIFAKQKWQSSPVTGTPFYRIKVAVNSGDIAASCRKGNRLNLFS